MIGSTAGSEANQLLAWLPEKAQRRLMRTLSAAPLRAQEVLYEPGRPIEYVYFPLRGALVALMRSLGDGGSFAPALVGYEGLVGVEVFLDSPSATFAATVLAGGDSLRMKAETARAALRPSGPLTALLHRYVQSLLLQFSQVGGCNRFHPLEQHFCSLLLWMQDNVTGELELTHEQFARVVGVRRVGITQVAQKLQRAGLIRYRWGKVTILDRQGLRARACVCYQMIEQARRNWLGVPPPS